MRRATVVGGVSAEELFPIVGLSLYKVLRRDFSFG
jgi:hypothetical protein